MRARRLLGLVVGAAVLLCPLLSTGMPARAAVAARTATHHVVHDAMSSGAAEMTPMDRDCCHHDGSGVPAFKGSAPSGEAPPAGSIGSAAGHRTAPSPAPSLVTRSHAETPLRC